ncbi:fumarylacetoacetate hydrolase family protein [Amycolatopsis azurea]|uniref:2-hydroxyhepta-2,4-diene-1,7-dioate isomerase n=1 Tax=Amycolatopsis azurea DSM 43854 TaxID=1238180 RepID=M2NQZ6_9PSEU|nr:fumarylacetoacetate hydrolase family protein [Amycolatopsis azurea]EMD24739.1 5-carboxymethyl-2-hydroxymuconate delta-isomerase [Amycolatopsis azurea DSM 43854]OOC08232.1 2-hydroxyhepta-2,4-diene-1,7-dioate isomerase [Amycolatopsis azurea DSM 43854]
MRLIRFDVEGTARTGCLDGDLVRSYDAVTGPGELVGPLSGVRLLAPCDPRTIVCVGSNYACQLKEKGRPWPERPALFLKAPNAVTGPGQPILHPPEVERLEYEGELAVVIGKTARNLTADSAFEHVLGYTCANDVTAHDWRADGQWARAKSADTFLPLGPWITTDIENGDLAVTTRINDRTVQRSTTGEMIFGVPAILAWVTRWFTLRPGDVVLTGSPAGVGPMKPGDEVTVAIEGVGELTNPVRSRER